MKTLFAKSFLKSIRTIKRRNTLSYKIFNFLVHDLKRLFKNIWIFRKVLWKYRWWDTWYNIHVFKTALEQTEKGLRLYGNEVIENRQRKVDAIKRVVAIMDNFLESNYIDRAEEELGKLADFSIGFKKEKETDLYEMIDTRSEEEKEHASKVYKRADEIENTEWEEMWKILMGKTLEEREAQKMKNDSDPESWEKFYNGEGLNTWWD